MTNINIDLELDGKVKFSKMDISFNQLNVIAGANNSGKSLMIKLAWFSSFMLQVYKVRLASLNPAEALVQLKEDINQAFPLTFSRPEQFSGFWEVKDEYLYSIQMKFEDGSLTWVDVDIINPGMMSITNIQQIQYRSRNTRTFDSYKQYLAMTKMLGMNFSGTDFNDEKVQQLCKFFPLYDIMALEGLRNDIQRKSGPVSEMGFNIESISVIESAIGIPYESIKELRVGEDEMPYFVVEDGTTRNIYLDQVSDGAQSMAMLTLFL